jgi:hypothetical protein
MARPSPDEFFPLPFFPYKERPLTIPLDIEECATALYLKTATSTPPRRG